MLTSIIIITKLKKYIALNKYYKNMTIDII